MPGHTMRSATAEARRSTWCKKSPDLCDLAFQSVDIDQVTDGLPYLRAEVQVVDPLLESGLPPGGSNPLAGASPGEAVRSGADERVPGLAGGHGLAESGPGTIRGGLPLVDVHPIGFDTERDQRVAMGGGAVRLDRHLCVADTFSHSQGVSG